jgi:hypothetical protein
MLMIAFLHEPHSRFNLNGYDKSRKSLWISAFGGFLMFVVSMNRACSN